MDDSGASPATGEQPPPLPPSVRSLSDRALAVESPASFFTTSPAWGGLLASQRPLSLSPFVPPSPADRMGVEARTVDTNDIDDPFQRSTASPVE